MDVDGQLGLYTRRDTQDAVVPEAEPAEADTAEGAQAGEASKTLWESFKRLATIIVVSNACINPYQVVDERIACERRPISAME